MRHKPVQHRKVASKSLLWAPITAPAGALGGAATGLGIGAARLGAGAGLRIGRGLARMAGRAPLPTAMALAFAPATLGQGFGSGSLPRPASAVTGEYARGMMPQIPKIAVDRGELEQLEKIASVLKEQQDVSALFKKAAGPGGGRSGGGNRPPGQPPATFRQGLSRLGKNVLPYLAMGGGLALAGSAIGLGEEGVRHGVAAIGERLHQRSMAKRYKEMVRVDPGLREEPRALQMFGVLDRMAPAISKEPVLAASAVRSMIAQPDVENTGRGVPLQDMNYIQQLLNVQGTRQKTRMPGAVGARTSVIGQHYRDLLAE